MIIRNLRWGYDGGGVACGPVEGNTVVEICVTANNLHNYFVIASRYSEFMTVLISPVPLFDVLMQMKSDGVEMDYEWEKCMSNAIEEYDYEISDAPEEMEHSEFAKAIQLVRVAMQNYYGNDNPETDEETAREFISSYVDVKLEEVELPKLVDDEEL